MAADPEGQAPLVGHFGPALLRLPASSTAGSILRPDRSSGAPPDRASALTRPTTCTGRRSEARPEVLDRRLNGTERPVACSRFSPDLARKGRDSSPGGVAIEMLATPLVQGSHGKCVDRERPEPDRAARRIADWQLEWPALEEAPMSESAADLNLFMGCWRFRTGRSTEFISWAHARPGRRTSPPAWWTTARDVADRLTPSARNSPGLPATLGPWIHARAIQALPAVTRRHDLKPEVGRPRSGSYRSASSLDQREDARADLSRLSPYDRTS
jgi:hypothetical protein